LKHVDSQVFTVPCASSRVTLTLTSDDMQVQKWNTVRTAYHACIDN